MAFYDSTLQLSNAQAITTTAASTTIYDVTGAGSGNAPSMTFGTSSNKKGFDIGTGDGTRPTAHFTVTTTGTGTGTLTIQVQAAPDNGSNAPGTYVTLAASDAYVGTTLIAGNQIDIPVPPYAQIAPAMGVPRFYRFNYVVSGTFTASLTGGILLDAPLGYISTQYGGNFIAA